MNLVDATPGRRMTGVTVLLLIAAALAAGAISAQFVMSRLSAAPAASQQPTAQPVSSGTAQTPLAPATIYKQAVKGVVVITTQTGSGFRGGQGTGSGIVLDKIGNILTNNHVVQGANQLHVTFSDGSTVDATVANTNPAEDLATIHVSVASSRLFPLTLGNSSNVLIGDTVYAIGAPFGNPESMSAGIVSGLNRTDQQLHGLIQTDARINPGNSGGPLLNTLGQVIGINDAIESPVQGNVGVGFAIPINNVRPAQGGNL